MGRRPAPAEPGTAWGSAGSWTTRAGTAGRPDRADDEASEDSFPASDPPAYASAGPRPGTAAASRAEPEAATPSRDLPGTELPDPEDRSDGRASISGRPSA